MSRVLLVEDSKVQALFATRVLESAGYVVEHVATGEDALEACYNDPPDIVLQDQHLAEMSGLEVCRRIKSDMALTAIPLLVLTAGHRERDHIAALDSGADAFLPKDSPNSEILAVVGRLIESATQTRTANNVLPTAGRSLRTRILAIDDSPTYLNTLVKKLTESGFEVEAAASGPEGLTKLREHSFDVAVVDVVMPEMNGFEVCATARRWAIKNRIPLGLLTITGSERTNVLVEALEAGADDYVTKLADLDVVLAHTTALARRIARVKQLDALNQLARRHQAADAANKIQSDVWAAIREQARPPLDGVMAEAEWLANAELSSEQSDHVVRLQEFVDALQHLLSGNEAEAPISPAAAGHELPDRDSPLPDDPATETRGVADREGILNWQGALERMMGHEDELQELARMFIDLCPQMVRDVQTAIESGDADKSLQRSAHTLKGSAEIFDATRVAEAAWRLERMGKNGVLDDADAAFEQLEQETTTLLSSLAIHCRDTTTITPSAAD